MSKIRRCQRILILSLLSLSVVAPLVFVSHRLNLLTPLGKFQFLSLSLSSRACLLLVILQCRFAFRHCLWLLRLILRLYVTVVSGRRDFLEDLYRAVSLLIWFVLLKLASRSSCFWLLRKSLSRRKCSFARFLVLDFKL